MKSVPATLSNTIRQAHNVYCKPRLVAEWNLNRYASPTAGNIPNESDYGFDVEQFPIESIYEANRPTRGINKARIGESYISDYSEQADAARYYVSSRDDTYKYWTSPVPTSGTTFPLYNQTFATTYEITDAGDGLDLTVVRPFINYAKVMLANKIVIKLENSYSSPSSYQVLAKTSVGGSFSNIGPANPTINTLGEIVMYHQGGGTWSTTIPAAGTSAPLTNIAGLMLRVNSMTVSNSYLNLIEISARREEDLSDRLISIESTADVSEQSLVYPIGTVTTNGANLTISNLDSIFDADNVGSSYYGIIEPNVKFTLSYVYIINGTSYVVQGFELYGGPWAGQKNETVNIVCEDFSRYFQEMKPAPTFYQDMSVSELIWRLCDQVGFVKYSVSKEPNNAQSRIKHFWANGEQNIWEIFDELSRATQTAVYFDAFGVLQIKPRTKAFENTTPVWTLRGAIDTNNAPSELPDIISLEQSDEVGTNHVTVSYQDTSFPKNEQGFPVMEEIWQPEGSAVLRASPLVNSITSTSTSLVMPPQDAEVWPFSGFIQVEGEIIEYEGKDYVCYPDGVATTKTLKSQDEKNDVDGKTPSNRKYQNAYNGRIRIKKRGAWNSEAKSHSVDVSGYTVISILNGTRKVGVSGMTHTRQESVATLKAMGKTVDPRDYILAVKGNQFDSGYTYYGARIRFNQGYPDQRAGIMFNTTNSENGYYVELQTTKSIGTNRSTRGEVMFYSRVGGVDKYLGKESTAIVDGRFVDLDVYYYTSGSNDKVKVSINGKTYFTATISGGNKHAAGGRFGMFIRGKTSASYEYLYAVQKAVAEIPDESTWYDRVRRAFSSTQWDREHVFSWRSTGRRARKNHNRAWRRWNGMFMDEFGPILHEVRQYDVKFDPSPALSSKLFISNDQVFCPEYISSSFGAKFVLVNGSRKNAILNGEDSTAGNASNQVCFVYGQVPTIAENETVVVKNDAQIAARGKVESDITSQWIQSKDTAQAIADWINQHWSSGADQQTVTIFGNPLLDLTDVVDVHFPDRNMDTSSHKYFVIGISHNFEQGLETILSLRRVT